MAGWMNGEQIRRHYSDPAFKDVFQQLWVLHSFFRHCIVVPSYQVPSKLSDAIELTPAGESWARELSSSFTTASTATIKFALFIALYHHDIYVDPAKTEASALLEHLDELIVGGQARFLWAFDRLLYDRFFDMFPSSPSRLTYDQAGMLLQDTPRGVFQLRDILVGPFGVLRSATQRFLTPTTRAPLAYCADLSCSAIHPVYLATGATEVSELCGHVEREDSSRLGSASEWIALTGPPSEHWYDDMNCTKLPWLLGNGFTEDELRVLTRDVFRRHAAEIRAALPNLNRYNRIRSGSPDQIVSTLSKAECLQILLLLSDEAIVFALESAVENKRIVVPVTEKRTIIVSHERGGWLNVAAQCSRFGVRFVASSSDIPLARLKRLIKTVYAERGGQLSWKVRRIAGESFEEKLDNYVFSEDPKKIVREVVFESPENITRSFELLRYGCFSFPDTQEEEEMLVEKVLWKLGFDVGLYPPVHGLFWERLRKFIDTAQSCRADDERERELIRAAGVNFYVSLEEILDQSLSFITWALLVDHYAVTKFLCNFDEARRVMASTLNGGILPSGEVLQLDANGKNTLFPLIQGFAVLANVCRERVRDRDSSRRQREELPGYSKYSSLQEFPFLHTVFVCDLRNSDRERLLAMLQNIASSLEASKLAAIRNSIDHRRASFPRYEEIRASCESVAQVITQMELSGIVPLIYLYTGMETDEFRRQWMTFKDYRGRSVKVHSPSQYGTAGVHVTRAPTIIVPAIHIGDSSELLLFRFQETSPYTDMWRDYPRRRTPIEEVTGMHVREGGSDDDSEDAGP